MELLNDAELALIEEGQCGAEDGIPLDDTAPGTEDEEPYAKPLLDAETLAENEYEEELYGYGAEDEEDPNWLEETAPGTEDEGPGPNPLLDALALQDAEEEAYGYAAEEDDERYDDAGYEEEEIDPGADDELPTPLLEALALQEAEYEAEEDS